MSPNQSYGPAQCVERWGVEPALIADLLALAGDKSDNIPGIDKCGPVTAAQWLKKYGSLEVVLSHASELGRFADQVAQKADLVRLWRKVVELDVAVPLEWEELFQKREAKPLVEPDYNDGFEDVGEIDPKGPDRIVVPASVELPKLEMPPTQAIEVARPQAVERADGMQPRSLDAAWKFSNAVFNSRLYPRFSTREQVFTVMVRGSEMGLGALTALDCFHMVEGRPTMHAHLIIARAMAHPDCEYFQLTETSAEKATYVTKSRRNPQPTTLTYTIADAKAAGVCPQNPREKPALNEKGRDSRGQWEKRPTEMLRKTAGVQLARVVYPAASLGLYATEELTDGDD
jgi:hypothetical protein